VSLDIAVSGPGPAVDKFLIILGWEIPAGGAELSMSWFGLGRDFSVFGGLAWVGSTIAKVLEI